jgi:hypothetical protein
MHFVGNREAITVAAPAFNSPGFRITNSTFDGAGVAGGGGGISVGFGGGTPVYVGSNSFANLSSGVAISFWSGATIERNAFTNSGTGIGLYAVSKVTVSANNIDSSDIGIDLGQEIVSSSVVGNTVQRSRIGIQVKEVPDARHGGDADDVIRSNNLSNNGAAGISVIDTLGKVSNVVIDANLATGNGFAPHGTTNAPIGTDPLNDGIYINVIAGSTVTLTNNHANSNADHGIEAVGVSTSSGNTATGNHGSSQCVGVTCS